MNAQRLTIVLTKNGKEKCSKKCEVPDVEVRVSAHCSLEKWIDSDTAKHYITLHYITFMHTGNSTHVSRSRYATKLPKLTKIIGETPGGGGQAGREE